MILVDNVHKQFGSQIVLNGVTLEIEDGKITTIVGPSGVGKSVLLKLILGIMDPDAGEILVLGESITRAKKESERNRIRSRLGVLFQSAALLDSLTVYENIAFPLIERRTASRTEIAREVELLLNALSLEQFAGSYPQEISIGTRKRVGMARCLITRPEVILIDEPNTGLDPLVGQEVYDLIKECRKRWGFTGVVISHELPEVFQISDKVAMLLQGQIVEIGSPQEFVKSENPAVQQFIYGGKDGPIKIQ